MEPKVRVYGKAQNRTALGVMHAYMTINPGATLEDLEKAFPADLAPDNGTKKIFVDHNAETSNGWDGYFKADDELLHCAGGRAVAVNKMWTKPSFERLADHAKKYGIEIAQFDPAEKGMGRKGSFSLEYLNGFTLPAQKKKGMPLWLWIVLAAIIVAIIASFLCMEM